MKIHRKVSKTKKERRGEGHNCPNLYYLIHCQCLPLAKPSHSPEARMVEMQKPPLTIWRTNLAILSPAVLPLEWPFLFAVTGSNTHCHEPALANLFWLPSLWELFVCAVCFPPGPALPLCPTHPLLRQKPQNIVAHTC